MIPPMIKQWPTPQRGTWEIMSQKKPVTTDVLVFCDERRSLIKRVYKAEVATEYKEANNKRNA